MRYIKQLFVILLISMLGEVCNALLPLPIPGAVYGLLLMLLCLQLGLVKLEQVQETGNFLLDMLPIMFIPFAVGMLPIWPTLQEMLIPLFVIGIVCTVLVFWVSGALTQLLMKGKGGQEIG